MASNQSSTKRGGRPRKHKTDADAAEAIRASKLRFYYRSRQNLGPASFIAYEPPHSDIPTDTPLSGLRTSSDIRIPADSHTQLSDILQTLQPISPPPTQLPPNNENAAITAQIEQIRINEQEENLEREQYEAEIAGILIELQSANIAEEVGTDERSDSSAIRPIESLNTADKEEKARNKESQQFYSPPIAFADESDMIWDQNSNAASNTSNRSASIQRTPKNAILLQMSTQFQSPSLSLSSGTSKGSTGKGSTGKGSKAFPVQKNNLLSWMKPLATRSPANSTPSPLVIERPSSNSSFLSSHQIENSIPFPSIQPRIQTALDPAVSTPNPASTPAPIIPQNATASPQLGSSPDSTASPAPTERTAVKLAKQLRNFQGCTHEQHREADQLHQKHHQRPDVHSKCSSFQEITDILRGNHRDTPLPDILSSDKLMKPMNLDGLDCQAAFESTSMSAASEDIGTCDEKLPINLCLSQHYTTSKKNRRPQISFDIDSTCCFPTSLAIARQGIHWYPKAHSTLNLGADIHFGLQVPGYNSRRVLTHRYIPLHKIPHYCFGTVVGIEKLLLFIFFPALHAESDYEHSTYLSKQDFDLWYDAILSPAVHKTIGSSNILGHLPATARVADIDSTALSAESLARKYSSREQHLQYTLQGQYLDALWTCILESIAENPGCCRFEGATLFMHAKNTKLKTLNVTDDLNVVYEGWEYLWPQTIDPQFYNKDRTFVDLAEQIASEDNALPYDQIPESQEAEVFLWRKCCLDAYKETRIIRNADGSAAKGNSKCTTYPWATMRDTAGQTLFAPPESKESQDGLVYSQFYALSKTPFDTSKVYVFNNESLENLALDPGYIRSLQQEGGGITFSKAVCEFGYLHSKKRAHHNLIDNQRRSYGIREEHRISLTMMEEIVELWRQWDLYEKEIDTVSSPLPYYIVPTTELFGFLYAQINKYCFLFEHVRAYTAMTYSLPETIMMVTALRALRFCYGSSLIQRESLLYKDRWDSLRKEKIVVKEGLGMRDTMERCGLGWFLPKINWATWRFVPPHGENILVGNIMMQAEYKRRWRAVKDLRDVYIRFSQAESWYNQYDMHRSPALLGKWLEYLHALNLEQFDADVWKAMLKAHQRSPELVSDTVKQRNIQFCHDNMQRRLFVIDGIASSPHFLTGNKMQFEDMKEVLDFLFMKDKEQRSGWGNKPYRIIFHKSIELIQRCLGYDRAWAWVDEFFFLVRLTHWVLPYPSSTALIASTKTSRTKGLKGRMMWFSAVYADPKKVKLPLKDNPKTLSIILRDAHYRTFGSGRSDKEWSTSQLIRACSTEGFRVYWQEKKTEDF